MKFPVTLERGEDGYIVVECPALPGCISQGKTEEEALVNIKDAIKGILQVRRKHRLPMPEVRVSEARIRNKAPRAVNLKKEVRHAHYRPRYSPL